MFLQFSYVEAHEILLYSKLYDSNLLPIDTVQ